MTVIPAQPAQMAAIAGMVARARINKARFSGTGVRRIGVCETPGSQNNEPWRKSRTACRPVSLVAPRRVGPSGTPGSEVAASLLLALDRLEQRLEVPLAEAERAVALDQLEEDRRAVANRPRE